MAVTQKNPNYDISDPYDRPPTRVGGSSVYGVLSDNNDSTYLTYTASGGSSCGVIEGFEDTSLVTGQYIRRVQIAVRFASNGGNPDTYVFFVDPQGRRTTVEDHYTQNLQGNTRTFGGQWHTVGPDGQPWTQDSLNAACVRAVDTCQGTALPNLAELSVNVETLHQPVVTPQADAAVTTTTTPAFNWSYTSLDGIPQSGYWVNVFTKAQTLAAGFDPAQTSPVVSSGQLAGTATTWQIPDPLTNGQTYEFYVLVDDGYSDSLWAHAEISVSIEGPAIPTLTLTTGDDPPLADLAVVSFDNLLSYDGSSGAEGSISPFTGSNCTMTRVGGATPLEGAYVARMTTTTTGDVVVRVDDKAIPVKPGLIYSSAASIRPSGVNQRTCNVQLTWWDQYGNSLGTSVGPDTKEILNGNGWTQLVLPAASAPLGVSSATLVVNIKGPGTSEYHDLDQLTVTAGAYNLVRNPTGEVDSDHDGLGDFWTSMLLGSGTIGHFHDNAIPAVDGSAWSAFNVADNSNLAGVQQAISLPGSVSGYYAYFSAIVYSLNDCTVRVNVDQVVYQDFPVSANTVTPVSGFAQLTDQASNGVAKVQLGILDANGTLYWTAMQVGISAVALASYDPNLNVWPNNWTRGGLAGTSTHQIQRSDDGEQSWVDVRRLDDSSTYYGGLQTYLVYDAEIPPNNPQVTYRARKVCTSSSGMVLSSAWSKYTRVGRALVPSTHWLVSTSVAGDAVACHVQQGMTEDRTEPQGEFKLLGRKNPVTVRGLQSGKSGKVTIECVDDAEYDAFAALRAVQETLWMASPLEGLSAYVDLGPSAEATITSTVTNDTLREISATYSERDRPPIIPRESPPVAVAPSSPAPVTPPTPPAYVGLLDDPTLPPAYAAYSVRALSGSAKSTNKALTVTRASDHTSQDIGFDSSGNLDVASIATFCSGTLGVVTKFWDQSGNGFHLACAEAKGWTICAPLMSPTVDAVTTLQGDDQNLSGTHNAGAHFDSGIALVFAGDSGTGSGTGVATAATYGGQAMTQIAQAQSTTSTNRSQTVFLLRNPPTGPQPVTVTYNNSSNNTPVANVVTVDHVDMATTYRAPVTSQSNSATSLSASITGDASTDLLLAAVTVKNNSPTAGSGQTAQGSIAHDSTYTYQELSTKAGSGSTDTMSYAWSGSADGVLIALALIAQPATVVYPPLYAGTNKLGARPALKATDTARGMQATGATFTGTKAAVCQVSVLQSGATSLSPRFLSFMGTSLADNDTGHSGGEMLARDGAGTVTQSYRLDRGSGPQATASATWDQLQQVTATAYDGVSGGYQITVDGVAGTAATVTLGAFNTTRIGLGHTGLTEQSQANQYVSEMISFTTQLSASQQGTVAVSQQTYFGTATQTSPPPTTGGTLVASDSLSSQTTPLPSGEWEVYDNGHSTSNAAAWMARDVYVDSGGILRLQGKKNSSPITVNGQQYLRECAAVYWRGPSGSALANQGIWQFDMKMDGSSLGWGNVAMTWAVDDSTYPWPTGREYDFCEIFSGNATKQGGESYLHYDSTAGSSRALHCPGSTTNSSSSDVAAGNYQVDWTTWHTLTFKFVRGSSLQIFIDGVSKAQVSGTSYNPSAPADAIRVGVQQEAYGTSDSASSSLFNTYLRNFRFYSL